MRNILLRLTLICFASACTIGLTTTGQRSTRRVSDAPVIDSNAAESLAIDQATLKQQMAQVAEQNRQLLENDSKTGEKVANLERDVSRIQGFGIGVASILTFLQILTLLDKRRGGKS